MMKSKRLVLATLAGLVLGTGAYSACSESYQFPVPCQNITAYRCPSGCTTTLSGTPRSDCVGVSDGCCQWTIQTFTCSGGTCGSSCSPVRAPYEFVHYKAFWRCQASGPLDHLCKPDPIWP